MYSTRFERRNPDSARLCANCCAPLEERTSVSLTRVEIEDEAPKEFPFPHDQLETGQALLLVKRGPNVGSTFSSRRTLRTASRSSESVAPVPPTRPRCHHPQRGQR